MFRSGLERGTSRTGSLAAVPAAIALLAAACGGGSTASVAAPSTTGESPGGSVTSITSATTTSTTPAIVCDFAAPTLGVNGTAESPTRQSAADHVSKVLVDRTEGCGHLVIWLGTDFTYDSPGPEAKVVPGGVIASITGNVLRVVLAGIERVDIDTVDPNLGDGVILARNDTRSGDLEVVVFPSGEFTDFGVRFLTSPARVAIDFSEAPLAPGGIEVPLTSEDVIVESITTSATDPSMDSGTVEIVGYARPFEAQMEAEVIDRYDEAVSVVCSDGCYISGEPTTRLGVPTTDWGEAWGEFHIVLTGLAPGSYTARFSNDAGAVDSPSWVEVPLVVRP